MGNGLIDACNSIGSTGSLAITSPASLGGDLDAMGYNINNCANITVSTINGFPAFPACTVLTTPPIVEYDLATFSSASYFVFKNGASITSITFTNTKVSPLDMSFWNLQNSDTTNDVDIMFDDGVTINNLGTLAHATPVGLTIVPTVGVLTLQSGVYYFYG
jgi:hypothetical protein